MVLGAIHANTREQTENAKSEEYKTREFRKKKGTTTLGEPERNHNGSLVAILQGVRVYLLGPDPIVPLKRYAAETAMKHTHKRKKCVRHTSPTLA